MTPRIKPSRCEGEFHEALLSSDDCVAEIKYDGGRYMLYLDGPNEVHLYSRRNFPSIDKAANVPQFARAIPGLTNMILDGEVMHPDANGLAKKLGCTPLGTTTRIMLMLPKKALAEQEKTGKLVYKVFDILYYDGQDVRHKPLRERRACCARARRTRRAPRS